MPNALVPDARIVEEVRKALAKSLRKDPAAVGMDASVIDDLGGTSLDFLDMTFRLEQAFGIRMSHQTLLDTVEETFGEGKAIDADGTLTADAVTLLKLRLPRATELEAGAYADEIPRLVTPETLANGVREILAALPPACTHCKATAWTSADGVKVACGACRKEAAYPDGDTLTKVWLAGVAKEKRLFGA
jgi:acyl carrier protein